MTISSLATNKMVSRVSHGLLHDTSRLLFTFSRIWHRLQVFPRLVPVVTKFLVQGSCACHWLQVFPRLKPVVTKIKFLVYGSCACHLLQVFPLLLPFACFPPLPLVTCFLTLAITHKFSSSKMYPHLVLVTCFNFALSAANMIIYLLIDMLMSLYFLYLLSLFLCFFILPAWKQRRK